MSRTAIGAALADVKAHVAASEQRIGANAKASVLFTTRHAADIDLESIHAIGVSGFEELCRRDGRFEAHAKGLFSTRAAEGARREARDAESNAATSKLVRAYLRLLSGYFTERAASKTIEYLIRRFKIHVYDVDDLIACAMPWHGTAEFVKVAQTCQLENSKHFKWLSGVKETGAAPPRDALAVRCSKDKAFFTFCAQSAAEMATTKGNVGSTSAFYAVLLTEAIGVMKEVDSSITTRLLPYLEAGLASAANAEQFAGALMVATQLAARTDMAEPLVEALIEGIAKGSRVPLHSQALQALFAICQTQRVKTLPERAFKHLVKIPELEELIADLVHSYRADAFSIPLVRSLAEFVDVHANYERVLRGVIEKVPLHAKHFMVMMPILLKTSKKGDAEAATVKSLLILADQKHPVATSEAVDFIMRGAVAKKKNDAHGEDTSKKDKLVASEEDASFLRSVLLGSASAPMAGHATSIHAALDHPNASMRESAIAQLAQLDTEVEKDGEPPSAIKRNSALGPAMLRRVSDDDPRVAAAAMELEALRRMVNDDGALFAAAKARLAVSATALAAGSAKSDEERRVAKKALRLTLGVLSKSEMDSSPSALAGRAAALALEYSLFSTSKSSKNVTKAALAAVRACNHPALDKVRGDDVRGVMESDKKDGSYGAACNSAVLAAFASSLSSVNKTWMNEEGKDERQLWIRESFRDANNVGRVTLLLACKLAVEETSGKSGAAASAIRAAAWSTVREHWSDGVGNANGVKFDEFVVSDVVDAEEVQKMVVSHSSAGKYVSSCARGLLRALLAALPKKAKDEADSILSECFRQLAMTSAKDSDAFDVAIGERLKDVLDACDRCYGTSGASAFLSARFAADPSVVDPRVQVAALELCQIASTVPSIAPVIVAAASSVSPVRAAAAALLGAFARAKNVSPVVKAIVAAAEEISLKGASKLCEAIEHGISAAKSPKSELVSFLEPVQEMTTAAIPMMDAYGARCLIASTRGFGDAGAKADVLLPVLSWSLDSMANDTNAKAALVVEILQAYTPDYASTFGKDGGEGWTLFMRCMVPPSPPAVRAAAFSCVTPEFAHALKTDPKAQLFKILFNAVNADADEVSRREAQVAVDALTIDANDVVKTLESALSNAPASTPAKKKGKTASAKSDSTVMLGSQELVQAAVTALEVLGWKIDKTEHLDKLVEPCQHFLEALLNEAAARAKKNDDEDDSDSDSEDSDDEAGVAAGGYIEALTLRTLESLALAKVKSKAWDVPLIIRAVREVSEGAARSAALACLAQVAHASPDAVLQHMFEVGSALSDRAAARDDVLSQRALENALTAVVPVWLKSGESLANVVSRLIDSLPSAPPRRRAPICAALIRASPAGEALPVIILNMLRRTKSLEESARELRVKSFAGDAVDVPVGDEDAWVGELLSSLLACESPVDSVTALVTALKESSADGARIVRLCAETSAKHLSMPQFIRAQKRVADVKDAERLQTGYAALAESAIVLLQSAAAIEKSPSKSKSSKSPVKNAAKAEASGQNLLSALDGLLAPGPFLSALTPLLAHKEGRVRRKVLALVTDRLQNGEHDTAGGDGAETAAGVTLIQQLSALIQSASATTSQAALVSLEAAAVRFTSSKDVTKALVGVVPAVISRLGAESQTLAASSALSLATLAKVLGIRMAPVINAAVPALIKTTTSAADSFSSDGNKHGGDGNEDMLVVHACIAAIRMFVKHLAGFMSPFLADVINVALHPAAVPKTGAPEVTGDVKAVHDLALTLRQELPTTIELRLLVRPLVDAWDSCVAHQGADGAASCAALLEIIAAAGDVDNASNAHRQQLFIVVLRALDIRRHAPVGAPEAALDAVEGAAVQACVSLALKCTESEFLPFFLQCVEWARARSGEAEVTRTRLAALFRLAASLADELRSVFVPFFRHLLDLAAAALDSDADPTSSKKKRKSSNSELVAQNDIWRMRKWTLGALRRCFQYDSVGFMDSNRYNLLYPLVAAQLKASPPADSDESDYEHFMDEDSFGAEAVAACSSLLAAAPDDAHWKPLHRAILMTGREELSRSKFLTIKTIDQVVDKLQEEYLALLPEAIPFMAELMEDFDTEIELETRKLTKRLSALSGEDLKSLMRDGFTPKGKKDEDKDDEDDDDDNDDDDDDDEESEESDY